MRGRSNYAMARVLGSADYPEIRGKVTFRQMANGVLVTADICGLPQDDCRPRVFGFHIHDGESCAGDESDPFANSEGHYNPTDMPHPYHAGDLPPLFGNHGRAYMSVLTDRFEVREIIGKVVIIHSHPDDFKSQPSGDAGEKIACGKIARV